MLMNHPDAFLAGTPNSPCWNGTADGVAELLQSHIIHPNKLHHSDKEWDFAQTVNRPAFGRAFSTDYSGSADDKSTSVGYYDVDDVVPFWCRI